MRRYFFEEPIVLGASLELSGDLFHHIFEVCRLDEGQHFELINSNQEAYLVQVQKILKKSAFVSVKEKRFLPSPRQPLIHLVMSIPRYPVFEATLEKAVELGVTSICLAYSEYSQVKSDKAFAFAKWERWNRIIVSATQQSGRGDLLKLVKPMEIFEISETINPLAGQMGLFAYEGEGGMPIKNYLGSLKSKNPKEIYIFTGGEGGFSKKEVERFQNLDFQPVTLGSQILRVETACVTLVSALKYEFDLLR